jgi:hypothetical protein
VKWALRYNEHFADLVFYDEWTHTQIEYDLKLIGPNPHEDVVDCGDELWRYDFVGGAVWFTRIDAFTLYIVYASESADGASEARARGLAFQGRKSHGRGRKPS